MSGFQVWLVEAWEADVAVVWLELSIHVFFAVTWVLEVLESLAISDVLAFKIDDDKVLSFNLVSFWNINAMTVPHIPADSFSIHLDLSDLLSFVVDEKTL